MDVKIWFAQNSMFAIETRSFDGTNIWFVSSSSSARARSFFTSSAAGTSRSVNK